MNRRSLFKSLAGIAVAASMQCFGVVDRVRVPLRLMLNPAWENASYESIIIFNKYAFQARWKHGLVGEPVSRYEWDGNDFAEVPKYVPVADNAAIPS